MPEIIFFANHKVHLMSLAMRGFFTSEFHSASHAHITSPEPFRKLSLRTAVYGGDHLGAAFL